MFLGVDVGVGVRVHDDVQAELLPYAPAQPFHAAVQVVPLLGGEFARLQFFRGLVVAPEGRDDHQVPGVHRPGEGGDFADVRPGLVPYVRAVVQRGEDRAGGDLQVAPGEFRVEDGGSVGR